MRRHHSTSNISAILIVIHTGDFSVAATGEDLQGESSYAGGYRSLFDMYLEMTQVRDGERAENWKAVASDTLIFVSPNIVVHHMLTRLLQSGLFSAVVAAFLTISIQDLRPDPQDKPTFYLENIYQLLADPNRTQVPALPSQSNPLAFSPPKSAVWVNSLWSLSLVITLSCALLAILLQQWTRRYIKLTQPRSASSPHQRARTCAFFDKGVEDLHLQWAVDALPILLHAPLVLFLVGLLVFTIGSNHTVFKVVGSWVGLCTVIYTCFTLLPIFRHESPYYTPLSSPLWLLYTGTLVVAFRILRWLTAFHCCNDKTWDRFGRLKDRYQKQFFDGIERVAEEYAQKSSPEIDSRILLWMLQSSDQDHELEQFFASIPNFYSSRVFGNPLAAFKASIGEKMADALVGLMDRTLSSDLLPQSKQRRITICNRALTEASLPISRRTLERVLYNDWDGLLDSVEFGLLLRNSCYSDPFAEYYSQCVVSVIIARAREHDDRWHELATGQLGISKSTLENYLAHGDSMLLANCVFMCRRIMDAYSEHDWRCDVYSRSKTLELVSRFNIQETLPGLQHEFCDMWNELVRNTGDRRTQNISIHILRHIRNVYFGLHQGTSAAPTAFSSTTFDRDSTLLFPRSYPSCQIARHHPVSTLSVDIGTFPAKEPYLEDMPSAPQGHSPIATLAHTLWMITVDSESHHLLPVLPFRETFGVIQGDACSPPSLCGVNVTPCATQAAPSRPRPFPQASPCPPGGTVVPPHRSVLSAISSHFKLNTPSSFLRYIQSPTSIDPFPFPATSASQFDPRIPREGHLTPAGASSYAPLGLVSVPGRRAAPGSAKFGAHKDARDLNIAVPAKVLQRPRPLAQSDNTWKVPHTFCVV